METRPWVWAGSREWQRTADSEGAAIVFRVWNITILISTNSFKEKNKHCNVLPILITKQPCKEARRFVNNKGKKENFIREPDTGQHVTKKGCIVFPHTTRVQKWSLHKQNVSTQSSAPAQTSASNSCPLITHPRTLFLLSKSSGAALKDSGDDVWAKHSGAWALAIIHNIY